MLHMSIILCVSMQPLAITDGETTALEDEIHVIIYTVLLYSCHFCSHCFFLQLRYTCFEISTLFLL
jgi:hypothetical protein